MKKLLTILFAVALGLNLSAQTVSPTYDPDVDGDNNIGINDLLALLSLFAENDEDDDGIWDSQDDCVGAYDECGVCNGPGPTVSVIESITILYDSVYAEQIDEWWVYEVGADTVFNYFCVTQLDDTNIHEAVDLWLSDESEALALYGPISAWDVSDVTNMSSLFSAASNFNGDIAAWDVSNVTMMDLMFWNAASFNSDISAWDVSNVTSMNRMFRNAHAFNADLSSWDVSSVTDMTAMFKGASNFNLDLSSWDVSSAIYLSQMFDDTPLSDENKCAIHLSFSANTNWPYEWADFCPFAIFNSCGDDIGYDGYDYATVQIGEQCWFAENLRTEHYTNGDTIPGELSDSEWSNADDTNFGAQAVYGEGTSLVYGGNDDEVTNLADYGRLYNWYAVDDGRGLCPSDWHVPTDEEFMTLEMELGMSESEANYSSTWRGTNQGTQMKSSPEDSPSWNGTNTSGFSGLAGGRRNHLGHFDRESGYGYFWSASIGGSSGWYRGLGGDYSGVERSHLYWRVGASVRCVRD